MTLSNQRMENKQIANAVSENTDQKLPVRNWIEYTDNIYAYNVLLSLRQGHTRGEATPNWGYTKLPLLS